MLHVSAMFLVSLSSAVSGDLASLRRFAQGGPPPPGARQVAGGGLNRIPSSSPIVATSEARPSAEVSGSPENREDIGIFFPIPAGSKVIKHVALPKLPTVQSNAAAPLQTPEHSTLLKALGKSDPGFAATNSGSRDLESKMGLVRIPKKQVIDPTLAVPNVPRDQQTLPTHLESQPGQPDFARNPQLQPSNPVPSRPPPSRAQFQPDESLFADDNAEVLSDPPQLSDDELELEAALSMIKNNWDFVKSGGRLIISHREDDPIIISKDSIQRL